MLKLKEKTKKPETPHPTPQKKEEQIRKKKIITAERKKNRKNKSEGKKKQKERIIYLRALQVIPAMKTHKVGMTVI